MGIGASIFLIAAGAILTFATSFYVYGIDLNVVGIILMVAGALGMFATMTIFGPRRRSSRGTVVSERRMYD